MKSNICILSIDKRYCRTISKILATSLNMYYADINELIVFDLQDVDEVRNLCGFEYVQKLELSKVKFVSTFENTLFTLDSHMLNNVKIYDTISKHALVIFLDMDKNTFYAKLKNQKLAKSDKQNQKDMFDDRSQILRPKSDIVIKCDGLKPNEVVRLIKEKILLFFKGE